jgi:PAS domain S-box-containing protein
MTPHSAEKKSLKEQVLTLARAGQWQLLEKLLDNTELQIEAENQKKIQDLTQEINHLTEDNYDKKERIAQLKNMLERRNLEFNTIFAQSPLAIVITDTSGAIEFVNPQFTQITGYSAEEAKGKNPKILKTNFTPQQTYVEMWKTISEGKIWKGEFINRKKNGQLFTEYAVIAPILDKNGSLEHYIALKEDITARKLAEEKLKESEERLALAFEGANDGVWDWNLQTDYVFYSPVWKKMLGYKDDEIEPHISSLRNLMHAGELIRTGRLLNKFLNGEIEKFEVEFELRHKLGHWVPILSRAVMQTDDAGKPIRLVGTHMDLTKIKEIEQQLRDLNATKDKFFSIIAHDLKNPFQTLIGLSEFLLENIGNLGKQSVTTYLQAIFESSKITYSLLENLLTWSRLQTGKILFMPVSFDLSFILEQNINLLKSSADRKEIELNCKSGENLFVTGDINMINTVIRNLIGNAIKFTPRKGKIAITYELLDSGYCQISVADSGVGIDSERLTTLFEVGQNNSTIGTENEMGSGLGLILCKEFIEKNSGKIWVESILGQGSRFIFTLKIAEKEIDNGQ